MGEQFAFIRLALERAEAGDNACIVWPFAILRDPNTGGYGTLQHEGKTRRAHVVSLREWTGIDGNAQKLEAAHWFCGNRACINPLHLRWATRRENAQDMVRHDRSPAGERHGRAKLTEEDVLEIRRRRQAGETCASVASRFGLNPCHVSRLARGLSWACIDRTVPGLPGLPGSDRPDGSPCAHDARTSTG